MRTSVAMATYNGAKYIQEQLDSFVEQTSVPDELVICDDGSTDKTIEILNHFKSSAPFKVHIYRNEKNLGYGQNFGKAMSLCTGDLIFLSDQDDVWFPEKIATICEIVTNNPKNHVFLNDALLTDGDLVSSGRTKLQQMKSARINIDSFVQGCCCAVRKEFLELALPLPKVYKAHDNWLVELAGYLDVKMVYEYALQFYRIHGENTGKYFLNTPNKIYFCHKVINRFKSVNKNNTSLLFLMEQKKLLALKNRLYDQINNECVKSISNDNVYKGLMTVSQKLNAVNNRERLLGKPRALRISGALSMMLKGEYQHHFNGFNSFVRDLILR